MTSDPFSKDYEPSTIARLEPSDPFGSVKEDKVSTPGMTVNRMSTAYAENDNKKPSRKPTVFEIPLTPEQHNTLGIMRSEGYKAPEVDVVDILDSAYRKGPS